MNKRFCKTLLRFVALSFVASLVIPAMAQDTPKVLDRDSVAYGRTYSEWSAAWEQWATSIPVSTHPLFDKGDCKVGQSGPVWFLGGKFCATEDTTCGFTNVVRTCTVPGDKALYIAVVNSEDSALEDPARPQVADLRAYVAGVIDMAEVSITVDGSPIPDVKQEFRVQSPAFSFTLPDNNIFKALYAPGPRVPKFYKGTYFPAVDDGVYVMLPPLSAGTHVVRIEGLFPEWSFGFDVTYNLTVE